MQDLPSPGDRPAGARPIGHHFQDILARNFQGLGVSAIPGNQPVLPMVLVAFLMMEPGIVELWSFVVLFLAVGFVKTPGVWKPFGWSELAPVVDYGKPDRTTEAPGGQKDVPFVADDVFQIIDVPAHRSSLKLQRLQQG